MRRPDAQLVCYQKVKIAVRNEPLKQLQRRLCYKNYNFSSPEPIDMPVDGARETGYPRMDRDPAQPMTVNVSKKGVDRRPHMALSQDIVCSRRGGVRQMGEIWRHEE